MKRQYKATGFIIDEAIVLIIGLLCGVFFASQLENKDAIWLLLILESLIVWSFGYLCRRLLLFSIDMMLVKTEKIVYFSKMNNYDEYEIKRGKYYCEWQFYSSEGTLKVTVPVELSKEEIFTMDKPKVDQKVKVTYYKYSKILYSWESV